MDDALDSRISQYAAESRSLNDLDLPTEEAFKSVILNSGDGSPGIDGIPYAVYRLLPDLFAEDLGAIPRGQWKGHRPASFWQWEALSELLQYSKLKTTGIRQFDFGTSYVKPTRLLLMSDMQDERFFDGPPQIRQRGLLPWPYRHDEGRHGVGQETGRQQLPYDRHSMLARPTLPAACTAFPNKFRALANYTNLCLRRAGRWGSLSAGNRGPGQHRRRPPEGRRTSEKGSLDA